MSRPAPLALFKPIRTRRVFEDAIAQIAEAIRAGDLRVGDRLPPERALAEQFDISRPTLREALEVLVSAGVLEARRGAHGGFFVCTETLPPNLGLDQVELRLAEVSEVLEARRLFEPRVAQLAALHGDEADFEALRETIDLQREFAADRERAHELELRFHLLLARATKNETIVDLMRVLHNKLGIARDARIRTEVEPEQAIETHERTLRAIMGGTQEEIEAVMDEHLGFLERAWEEQSGRRRIRVVPEFLLSRRPDRQ